MAIKNLALFKGRGFLTNKEKVLSGSIEPLRGNEEAGSQWPQAFELTVAGAVPSFLLSYEAKSKT